jgi:hypothetical protein
MTHIFRPCYRNPEMLYHSLQYEVAARERFLGGDRIVTVFAIDGGFDPLVLKLANDFSYPKKILTHADNVGSAQNTLDGFRAIRDEIDDYILYIQDSTLMHQDCLVFTEDNIERLRTPHTCGLSLQWYLKDEDVQPNLDIFEVVPTWFGDWGMCITKEFINRLYAEKDLLHNMFDCYIMPIVQQEGWRNFAVYINRCMDIGIYGTHQSQKVDFPYYASHQDKVDWFAKHIQIGDWWEYCPLILDILQKQGANIVPNNMRKFNSLLDTWQPKHSARKGLI